MNHASSSTSRVPAEERLFSLVLALIATEPGLTKSEILSTVQGYRQRFVFGGDNSSLERQFERDKDDIRDIGIPLETLESPDAPGNNQTLRYRISKTAYDLPDDITFTPREMTLLALAAMVWRHGSLSGESRRALMKLRSLGVETDEPLVGFAPRVSTREAAFQPLDTAIQRHLIVRFAYLKPGESSARVRTVAPRALVNYEGRWHVTGLDQDLGERRTFLLARIVGEVSLTHSRVDLPVDDVAEQTQRELDEIWAHNVADIEVMSGTDADVRLGHVDGHPLGNNPMTCRREIHFLDRDVFADELTRYGPEVRVHAPDDLRDAVVSRLRRVVSAHGESEEQES